MLNYTEVNIYEQLADALDNERAKYRKAASMLTAFGDAAPNLFWVKDLQGIYVHCNMPHAKWLGAESSDEVVGKDDLYFAQRSIAMAPNDPRFHEFGAVCGNSDRVVIENGIRGVFLEFGNVRGEFCAFRVSKTPWKNAAGEIIGTVGSAYDLTERVVLSEALVKKMDALKDLIDNDETIDHTIREKYNEVRKDFMALNDRHKYSKGQKYHG